MRLFPLFLYTKIEAVHVFLVDAILVCEQIAEVGYLQKQEYEFSSLFAQFSHFLGNCNRNPILILFLHDSPEL
ncbi:hypothetical protein TELCIR_19523 [Teladorsagia circumcincta]|uniref:Uncharacterized protein n=1 Tax=Teladorsagia circumcincta TaxID=45464 RepID=A0A2G9TM25_TELCI|nr:hypothetical protein TELCIR_19523 [Teladorsagia circumcincta]